MISSEELMLDYARRTGLIEEVASSYHNRYLWTDAFAVCNFLGLYRKTNDDAFKELALSLVDQVHQVLGKYRDDDTRSGWLGSKEQPTSNGLRIGKPLPERRNDEKYDQLLEWDRDGQYFHYLTKWMHALLQTGKATGVYKYFRWSHDLAIASLRFIKGNQMYWKMSTDLSYPLVASMGLHDPIDGYITFKSLQTDDSEIKHGMIQFRALIEQINPGTTDPLGLGGLLLDIYRLEQLGKEEELQQHLIRAVESGLKSTHLDHQLAFRELGLTIGLIAAKKMNILKDYWFLIDQINKYWVNQRDWTEHRNINQVMLATSLSPQGVLDF
ncbi:MAG: hypothetical protein ACXAD7_09665 [Candidatus Kariarchaeaceae archaeon]|jgi:hypothetical protein